MLKPVVACVLLTVVTSCARPEKPVADPVAADGPVKPSVFVEDLAKAKDMAQASDRPIILFFTGSDWCGYCMQLQEDVFSKPEWQTYASDKFILVPVDKPKDESLVPEQYRARNQALVQQYQIKGFPSFVLLAPDGETVVDQFGLGPDRSLYGTIAHFGGAGRLAPSRIERTVANLPPDTAAQYRRTLEDLRRSGDELDVWLAEKPETTPENTKHFKTASAKVEKLTGQARELERDQSLRTITSTEQSFDEATKCLSESRNLVSLLTDLKAAQHALDSWLAGRPANGPSTHETYRQLRTRVDGAMTAIREVLR